MIHTQVLAKREKILALIGAALLLVFVIVGYTQARQSGETSVLLAQEDDRINQDNYLKNQQYYIKNLRREFEHILARANDTIKQVLNTALTSPEEAMYMLDSLEEFEQEWFETLNRDAPEEFEEGEF